MATLSQHSTTLTQRHSGSLAAVRDYTGPARAPSLHCAGWVSGEGVGHKWSKHMPTRPIIIALAIALISGGLGCGGGEINSGQVSVAVTPEQASVQSQGTVTFTAAVTGTSPNQSTAVTWSVEETRGGHRT